MTTASNRRQLKRLLINPQYQMKYILWLASTGLLLTALNCAVFYSFMHENYSILVDLAPMTDQAKGQLYGELRQIVVYLGLASLVFLALVSMLGVFMTHRTAGPLYHFKRVFSEIKNGDRDLRIQLRPGDDFKDVAQAFNEMMDTISNKKS